MSEPVTKKPCIDICEFSQQRCIACGRTKQEKSDWKHLSASEKQAIWTRVLDSHGSGSSKQAKALRALYEKARKKARKNAKAK